MEPQSPHTQSYLFTVRLWLEHLGDGQHEWRGKVKNVLSEEECSFRDVATLGELLAGMLPRSAEVLRGEKERRK